MLTEETLRKHGETYAWVANISWIATILLFYATFVPPDTVRSVQISGRSLSFWLLIVVAVVTLGPTFIFNGMAGRWAVDEKTRKWSNRVSVVAFFSLLGLLLFVAGSMIHLQQPVDVESMAKNMDIRQITEALKSARIKWQMGEADDFAFALLVFAIYYAFFDWRVQNHPAYQSRSVRGLGTIDFVETGSTRSAAATGPMTPASQHAEGNFFNFNMDGRDVDVHCGPDGSTTVRTANPEPDPASVPRRPLFRSPPAAEPVSTTQEPETGPRWGIEPTPPGTPHE